MPISDSTRSLYRGGLRSFISNPDSGFTSLDPYKYGEGVNFFSESFKTSNGLTDEEMSELGSDADEVLSKFKNDANVPRFVPSQEDMATLYDPISINPNAPIQERIKQIDAWKDSSYNKSKSILPANAEDLRIHLNLMSNSLIRDEVGKDSKTGFVGDKFYRAIEGFARMGTSFADVEWADRFMAESLPENPDMDKDFTSDLASGVGELTSQALYSLAVSATIGPEAVPLALMSLYSARAMKEGVDIEFKRSGDMEKALDAGVASIPGAALETVADSLLFKSGSATHKMFADRFLAATSDAAKRQVLREAVPVLSKEILKNGFSEATVGAIGADFATGYGRYLATGDASYIPTPDELLKGAAVEGILGAAYTGVTGGNVNSETMGVARELVEQNKTRQREIYQALKKKDFASAIELANSVGVPSIGNQPPVSNSIELQSKNNETDGSTVSAAGDANNIISDESSISSQFRPIGFSSAARLDAKSKKMRDAGNVTEADRLQASANSIRQKTYQSPSMFNAPKKIFEAEGGSLQPSPFVAESDIILADGTLLPKDKNIMFVKGVSRSQLEEVNASNEGVSIMFNPDLKTANLVVQNPDGTIVRDSRNIEYSQSPRKGFMAIEVPSAVNVNNSLATNSFSIIGNGPVALYAKTNKAEIENPGMSMDEVAYNNFISLLDQLEKGTVQSPDTLQQDVEAALVFAEKFLSSSADQVSKNTVSEYADSMIDLFEDYDPVKRRNEALANFQPERQASIFGQSSRQNAIDAAKTLLDMDGLPATYNDIDGIIALSDSGEVFLNTPEGAGYLIEGHNYEADLRDVEGLIVDKSYPMQPKVAPQTPRNFESKSRDWSRVTGVAVPNIRKLLNRGTETQSIQSMIDAALDYINTPKSPDVFDRTEFTLGPDSTGMMYKFENGAKVYPNGNSIQLFGNKPEGHNPIVVIPATASNPVIEVTALDDKVDLTEPEIIDAVSEKTPEEISQTVTDIEKMITPEFVEDVLPLANKAIEDRNDPKASNEFHAVYVEMTDAEISPSDVLDYIESNPFLNALNNFISTLGDKGKAAWTPEKIGDALNFFNTGDKGGLTTIQVNRVNEIINEVDPNRADSVADEVQSRRRVEEEFLRRARERERSDKIALSVAPENDSGQRITFSEALRYISDNDLPVHIESGGEQTRRIRGRTDFRKDGAVKISVNINGIHDLQMLKNVINEEIGHVIYNNPNLRELIAPIANSTEANQELSRYYSEDLVYEESVVKRVASLVDQYNENGTFNKIITAIRVAIKDAFGITLNDSDLAYIAHRSIKRALEDPTFLTSYYQTNDNRFSTVEAAGTIDLLNEIDGILSNDKKRVYNKIGGMLKSKLEQELVIDEPESWKAIKSLDFQYLSTESVKRFSSLVDDFVNTRRKRKNPSQVSVRLNQEQILNTISDLAKEAKQGQFDFYQQLYPSLEGKDLQSDFAGDMDVVVQHIKDASAVEVAAPDNDFAMDNYQAKIIELQQLVSKFAKEKFDEKFPTFSATTGNDLLNEHIGKLNSVAGEQIAKMRQFAEQWYNQMMRPPYDLNFKDTRKLYYRLMSFMSDGYALDIDNFISDQMAEVLVEAGKVSATNPFSSKGEKGRFIKSASFATNIRRLGDDMANLMFKMVAPFRSGINASERIQSEFVRPYLDAAIRKAQKISGKNYNNSILNQIGAYALGRAYKISENATEGLLRNKRYILDSISKYKENYDTGLASAAIEQEAFVQSLFEGISENTDPTEAMAIYESNAAKTLDQGMIGYAKDVSDMFSATKDLAKFTTEFTYGRPFEEWVNYIPAFAIENDGVIHMDLTEMHASDDDRIYSDLTENTNMVTGGLGSTKERTRRLGASKVLVLNINSLAEGRMRVNMLDYMTAMPRRELNNIISSKGSRFGSLTELLQDPRGNKGRVQLVQHAVRTMWNNSIQSASFVSDFQVAGNVIANIWSSVKLSSFYQLPAQFLSNTVPYFIANFGSPQKIAYLFEAGNKIIQYRAGKITDPRLNKVIGDILYAIDSRQQDTFLDKSIALDVPSNGMWQIIKGSKMFSVVKDINNLREKLLFWQFKASDELSGAPMMLAEYYSREVAAGRASSWEGLTFNDESYFGALDEIERFIGIGAASRRGVWLNNKNGWINLVRNMVSAFSSHRINNATNFRNELFKVTNKNISPQERINSVKYMSGIVAQSATFTGIKFLALAGFYNILTDFMGDDENEDELEQALAKMVSGQYSADQKKMIKAEIDMRKKIRAEFKRVKDANTDEEVIMMSFMKDAISNAFIFPAITEVPLNAVIHFTYDKLEAESFKNTKQATVEDLEAKLKIAKDRKQYGQAIELQKEIFKWQSQEAIQLVYENRGIVPFDGIYGGVLKDMEKVVSKASGSLVGAQSYTMADLFMTLGIAGIGQADMNRVVRMYSKRGEYEQQYREALAEIEEERIKSMRANR